MSALRLRLSRSFSINTNCVRTSTFSSNSVMRASFAASWASRAATRASSSADVLVAQLGHASAGQASRASTRN
jgi:hypothetical protein